jgi:hypothetical protein
MPPSKKPPLPLPPPLSVTLLQRQNQRPFLGFRSRDAFENNVIIAFFTTIAMMTFFSRPLDSIGFHHPPPLPRLLPAAAAAEVHAGKSARGSLRSPRF